ncbi:unnamed protein product [Trichobilharzia szidati]|nr:unnamed protein product [Trichobilharzia szidati]
MSRRLSPYSELPTYPLHKMESNGIISSKSIRIHPYIKGAFLETGKTESIEKILVGSLDFSVMVCDSAYSESIELAKNFVYDPMSIASFIQKLSNSVEDHISSLLDCISASLEFESSSFYREVFHEIIKKLKCFLKYPCMEESYFYCPIHIIENGDCDIFSHITFILRYLCCPVYRGKPHGLVIKCESPQMMAPLFMLTEIIHDSKPPNHLFAFLPSVSKSIEKSSVSRTISMVFQTSDIDSAARYCLSSLESTLGTGMWHSPITLVEESVHKRFIDRVKNILSSNSTNATSSGHPSYCAKYISEVKSHANAVGASVLCCDQDAQKLPIIVYDIAPSLIRLEKHRGPVGFVVCFRSIKEGVSLLKHFVNLLSNHKLNNIPSTYCETVVNMWQTDSNVIWQLYQMLLLSGVDNIFVNTSSRQLAATMYTRFFEINGSSFLPSGGGCGGTFIPETETSLYRTVASLITAAHNAQVSWISKGYESIQSEILKGEVLPGIPLEKEAFKYVIDYSRKLLGDPGKQFLTERKKETLLVSQAHICLKPSGPIIVVVDCRFMSDCKKYTFLLKIVLCALFAGNSVVLLMTNSELINSENTFMNYIKLIQGRLSVASLITVHNCTPSPTHDVYSLLSNLCSPTTLLSLDNEGIFSQDPYNCISNLLCLSRPVTLYWSTGCNVFS